MRVFRSYFLRTFVCLANLLALTGLLGCSSVPYDTMSYYWQASVGHLSILSAARPVDELLETKDGSPRLLAQLEYSRQIRAFSIQKLHLPDNPSYRTYADIHRPYPVWNVLAAPATSLELEKWCFPLLGCISYKGFYSEADAKGLSERLRSESKGLEKGDSVTLDVAVMGVPAYSTLGFTSDPLLSSFIYYPTGELARLIFHELSHQVVYIADDTTFNESFATAVEELGIAEWLALPGHEKLAAEYRQFDAKRSTFRVLISNTRADLERIYSSDLTELEKLELKRIRIDRLRSDYESIKVDLWGGWSGYDRFFNEDLNNAKLAVSGLYTDYVPAFKVMFERAGRDYPRFYSAVKALGEKAKEERDQLLQAMLMGLPS